MAPALRMTRFSKSAKSFFAIFVSLSFFWNEEEIWEKEMSGRSSWAGGGFLFYLVFSNVFFSNAGFGSGYRVTWDCPVDIALPFPRGMIFIIVSTHHTIVAPSGELVFGIAVRKKTHNY